MSAPPPAAKSAFLDLKLPPLLLLVLAAAAMAGLPDARRFAAPVLPCLALALVGAGISLAGVLAFRRARTTVDPMHPDAASALVAGGIYRFTRNPMYLGFAVLLLAWGLYLSKLSALAMLALFMLYLTRFQIRPEEAALRQRFGAAFEAYAARVGRWL